jgi:hypothetical protein
MTRAARIFCSLLFLAGAGRASAEPMIAKAGEWEVAVTNNGIGQMMKDQSPQKICLATDKSPADLRARHGFFKNCGEPAISAGGDAVSVHMSCASPIGGNFDVHAVITRSGANAFHNETQVRMQGMPAELRLASDARRLGPCQPGDQTVQ